MVYDPERPRPDREARDSRGRGGRRDSTFSNDRRQSIDHARPPKRAHMADGAQDLKSGPYRERSGVSSPPASASTRNEPLADSAPSRTNSSKASMPHSTDPSNPVLAQSMKQVMNLVGDRMYWYKLREDAEKHRKKLEQSLSRQQMRPNDMNSTLAILTKELTTTEAEIVKIEGRMAEDDAKIVATLGPFLQSWRPDRSGTATSPPSTANEQKGSEAKLTTTKPSVKQDLATDPKQNSSRLEETQNQNNALKVKRLESLLTEQTKRGDALEQQLATLEAKFNEFANAHGSKRDTPVPPTTEVSTKIEEAMKKQEDQTNDLASRLHRVEEDVEGLSGLAEQFNDHENELKTNRSKHAETSTALATLQSLVSKYSSDALENMMTEISGLKEQIQRPGGYQEPIPISNEKILQLVRPELEKSSQSLRVMISSIQTKIMPFLKEERNRGTEMQASIDNINQQVSEVREDIASVKTEYAESTEKVTQQTRKFAEDLTYHGQRIMSMETRVDGVQRDTRTDAEGVHAQLQALNTWQSNFDTRGLYKDILSHINATLPDGVNQQIRRLNQRVEGMEMRLGSNDDAPLKRRKLPNGNPIAADGHH